MFTTNHNLLFKATVLALCVISAVHVFVSPLYEGGGGGDEGPAAPGDQGAQLSRTFREVERGLCLMVGRRATRQRRARRTSPDWASKCPRDGIVTARQGGRLGNQMWEYATVWAVARRTGLEAYVPRLGPLLDEMNKRAGPI